jgi:hypothetical protein
MLLRRIGSGRTMFFYEMLMGIVRANATDMTQLRKTMLRVALMALALLMAPLLASQVVEGWNWNPWTFVFAYVAFFGTGLAYAFIARKMGAWAYKAGVGLALLTGFVMGWTNMVHMTESENPANLVYFGVLAVGGVGARVARLEARGMALALFAMAAALGVVALIDAKSSDAPELVRQMSLMRGVFVLLFTASGLLFRHASLARSK